MPILVPRPLSLLPRGERIERLRHNADERQLKVSPTVHAVQFRFEVKLEVAETKLTYLRQELGRRNYSLCFGGPAVDLGRALAAHIGVEIVFVEYPRPGAVMEGVHSNAWDVAFLAFDPSRAEGVDYTPAYIRSDFTYMVPAGSSLRSAADTDQPGIRIVTPRNDGSDLQLTRALKRAQLVRTDSQAAALELLRTGGAEARAAPRPTLLADVPKLPGSRVLDDGFGPMSFAAMVPKGRSGWLAYVSDFIEQAKVSGVLKRSIEAAGLQGVEMAPSTTPRGL
jgi:polar amino acid transport system substrate-binding protein